MQSNGEGNSISGNSSRIARSLYGTPSVYVAGVGRNGSIGGGHTLVFAFSLAAFSAIFLFSADGRFTRSYLHGGYLPFSSSALRWKTTCLGLGSSDVRYCLWFVSCTFFFFLSPFCTLIE